jgi:hypothetical protein
LEFETKSMGSWKSSSQATAGTAACNDVIVLYFGAGNQDVRICTLFPHGEDLRQPSAPAAWHNARPKPVAQAVTVDPPLAKTRQGAGHPQPGGVKLQTSFILAS